MKQNTCSLVGTRDEQIVAYLYEEGPLDERLIFERHLASCALCRTEVDALRGVRSELGLWASPEPAFTVTIPPPHGHHVPPHAHDRAPVASSARGWPVWAQAMAAVLLVGVGAGVANLDVSYSSTQGLLVRTGWNHPEAAAASTPAAASLTAGQAVAAPWRTELAEFEERLRGELMARPVAMAASPGATDDSELRRVRALLLDSEQRQRRDLALRLAELAREVESQRQSDLARIDRNLGIIQSRTGMEVMRTQQQVNSLAQRVSQRP